MSSVQETRPTKSRTFNLLAALPPGHRGPVQLYANARDSVTGLQGGTRGRLLCDAPVRIMYTVHHPDREMVVTFLLSHPINYRAYNI